MPAWSIGTSQRCLLNSFL